MKNKNGKLFAIIMSAFLINGCEDSGTSALPVQNIAEIEADVGYATLQPGQKRYISLAEWVTVAGNANVIDLHVVQGDDSCGTPDISGLGFYIQANQEGSCRIDYVVESVPGTNEISEQASSSVGILSSEDQQAELPPISVAINNNQLVTIDLPSKLGAHYPSGYVLSSSLTVLGAGSASADSVLNQIQFQANLEGLSRVIYTLESSDPAMPDTKVGFIDISVSGEASQPPVALPFTHSVQPLVNQTVEIDVLGYISDPDNDPLQLVNVQSFYANVTSTDPSDVLNTKLNFTAAQPGLHYVSYMVSDHRGGFSSNIIEVRVQDPSQVRQWSDIELGLNVFSAPLTAQEAESQSVEFSGRLIDEGYNPAIMMAIFSASKATDYCAGIGRLPTSSELSDLVAQKSPTTLLNWPNQTTYIADDAGYLNTVDLSTGGSTPYIKGHQYVTCYSDGAMTTNVVNDRAIADGLAQVVVEVTLMLNGTPAVGEYIDASITGFAELGSRSVLTDGLGIARFTATSSTAEYVDMTFSYQSKVDVTERVEFIGNSDDSYLSSLTLVSDGAAADGFEVNHLTALVLDRNNNPVKDVNVDVLIWEETENSSTVAPTSLTTNELGEVYIEVSNTEQEYVDVRAYYTSTNSPPEISFGDQRIQFYRYNTLKPVLANGLVWTPPFTEQEALDLEASDPNINFGPDMTYTEDGTYGPNGMVVARYNWLHADDFCYYLDYAGHRDWRLPTEAELVSFYQSSQPDHPDKGIFTLHGWPTFYALWSSDYGDPGYNRVVRLYDGNVDQALDTYSRYVSCVR